MALDLSEIRQQITQIDRSLLKLLSERHRLAYDVVRSKEVTQKALRDLEREQQLLQELVQFAESQNYQLEPQYITSVFQKSLKILCSHSKCICRKNSMSNEKKRYMSLS